MKLYNRIEKVFQANDGNKKEQDIKPVHSKLADFDV